MKQNYTDIYIEVSKEEVEKLQNDRLIWNVNRRIGNKIESTCAFIAMKK